MNPERLIGDAKALALSLVAELFARRCRAPISKWRAKADSPC